MRKINSTVLIVIAMALVSMACLFFSASYAYVVGSGNTSKAQTITTGNLAASIVFQNATYPQMVPLEDTAGLAQTTYGTISVSKNNKYSVYYQLNLKYSSSLPSGKTSGDLMPLENVKVALYKIENNVIGTTPIVGPVRIGNLPVAKFDGNILNTEYKLYANKFNTGSDSIKYALKVWLDSSTDEDFNGKILYLDAAVVQEPLMSKNYYNMTGKVYVNGALAKGAQVTINNVNGTATTNTSGVYTLSNVVEGKYQLTVKYNNVVYETAINIAGGTTKKVVKTAGKSIAAGVTVQKAAYDNNTTVYQIMSLNNKLLNSNAATASSYNTPNSYTIYGLQSIGVQALGNINIKITNNNINIEYEA